MKPLYFILGGILLISFLTGFYITRESSFSLTPFSFGAPQVATSDTISVLRTSYNTLANEVGSSSRPAAIGSVLANNFPFWTTAASSTLSATSTLTRVGLSLFAGGSFNASGTISVNGDAVSTSTSVFSTSSAHSWLALQTFNGGIAFSTATGTSATSTITAFSANFQELRVASSTITADVAINGAVQGALNVSSTLNVTGAANLQSTLDVIGISTLRGFTFTNATGTGNFQAATFVSTGLATFNTLNVTSGDEYRRHAASVVIVNPSATVHSTGTVTIFFPVAATINYIDCISRPSGSSTIQMDRRVSSTPATAGTNILSVFECNTTAAATSTIASSTMTAGTILNIKIGGTTGNPSSTSIHVDFSTTD